MLVWRIGLRVLDERRAVLAAVLFWIWPTYFDWKSTRAHGFYGSELFLGLAVLLLVPPAPRAAVAAGSRPSRPRPRLRPLVEPAGRDRGAPDARLARLGAAVDRPRLVDRARRAESSAASRGSSGTSTTAGIRCIPAATRVPWLNHVHNLVVSTLPEALGLRLAWSYEWLGGVAVGLVIYALLVAGFLWLLWRRPPRLTPLLLIVLVFPIFYFVSPYTWLESEPRYLTLVMPVFALLIASALTTAWRAAAVLAVAVALSVGGMVELERHHVVAVPDGGRRRRPASIAPVLDTLRAHDLHYAFASYWIAWRITFESDLRIVGGKDELRRIPFVRNGRVEPGRAAERPRLLARRTTHGSTRTGRSRTSSSSAATSSRRCGRSCAKRATRRLVSGRFAIWIPPGPESRDAPASSAKSATTSEVAREDPPRERACPSSSSCRAR